MKSNYDILGNHIRLIDTRNRESITDRVLGINIDKFFMPSVANVIGTDLSKYKLITKGKFACNPMHVGRDERLPVALYDEEKPAIVSPAYFMFEVIDNSILKEDYLIGETMEDKILRIVRNDMVTNDGTYGIMETPQMSRQSERSAS